MKGLRFVARVTRAPFLPAALMPVLVGACVAYAHSRSLRVDLLALTIAGALAIQVGLSTSNDYYDHLSGNDEDHPNPTPFSGGGRAIQEGLIEPRRVLTISMACYLVGAAIGLYLAWARGWPILAIGIVGIILAYQYNAPPLRFAYHGHGLGEAAVGIGFGPLIIAGAYYVQMQRFDGEMLLVSLPIALLMGAMQIINSLPDVVADRSANKQTLAVVLGLGSAVRIYSVLLLGAYITLAVAIVIGIVPLVGIMALMPLPMAIRTVLIARRSGGRVPEILPANAATIQLHFLTGLLLCLAYVLTGLLS
jgi:1,4-dihydroxy-2-naphthoate polyprenyltransferase